MRLIAEYKRESPWDGVLTDKDIREAICDYDSDPNVWGISIVIDPDWGGKPVADLRTAAGLTRKPILVKAGPEFIEWQHQCFGGWYRSQIEDGATFCLEYDWTAASEYPANAWLEIHHASDIPPSLDHLPLTVVCNNRDVRTGEIDPVRALELAEHHLRKASSLICAASGYDMSDYRAAEKYQWGFDFMLMGTELLKTK